MSYIFNCHYNSGDKKFHNIHQAFNEQKCSGHFTSFTVDAQLIEALNHCGKPQHLTPDYIKKLMITRLKTLRKKYRKMKLLYSGGTDSYTILKLCVENDIYVDETITQMISMNNDIRTNLEYIPGLRSAKKYEGKMIGKITELHPTDQDLEFVNDPYWFCDPYMAPGSSVPWRPYSLPKMVDIAKDGDNDTIVLAGYEKPRILIENNKPHWVILDSDCGEMMGTTNTVPFFSDKENPELAVALSYVMLKHIDIRGYKSGTLLGFQNLETSVKKKLLPAYGFSVLPNNFINMALLGKTPYNFNRKTAGFYKELKRNGKDHFIDKMFETRKRIISLYKDVPHAIEVNGLMVKTVGRYSKKIQILQDKFSS